MHKSLRIRRRRIVCARVTVVTALVLATILWGASLEVVWGQASEVLVFEGARLIPGDGSAPIENAAFIVRQGKIEQVGPRGTLQVPNGARHVDLTGKTVMPMLINLHGHIGYLKGTAVDPKNFTREQVLDELRRHQYYGVGVVQVLGTDRNDLELLIRDEQRSGVLTDPSLAMLFSAGAGIVAPNGGAPNGGPPFAVDVMREAGSDAQGRQHVRELAAQKVDVVKMWVDDRNGKFPKLKPEVYRAIIDEAHQLKLKVIVHATLLDDTKELIKAGVDGLAHPVRSGPIDDEFVELIKAHDVFQCTTVGLGGKTAWIDDPALADTVTPAVRAAMKPPAASNTNAPPSKVRVLSSPAPSQTEEMLANTTSDSMMTEVVLARRRVAPYCSPMLPIRNIRLTAPTPISHTPCTGGSIGTSPACTPSMAVKVAMSAPPANMASMLELVGCWCRRRSMTLVSAKQKPPISARPSAMLLGQGQGDSGDLSTITTPVRASARRASEPWLGFSPSRGQANTTTQAGIR